MSRDPKDKKPLSLDDVVARGSALCAEPEWKPSAGLLEAVAEIQRLDELPAPDPVVLLPEKGGQVVVTSTEAAETYVGPTAVPTVLSPRMPTGPVKIRTDVDPRRAVTLPRIDEPAEPKGVVQPSEPHGMAKPAEPQVEEAPAPSVAVPSGKVSSRPAANKRRRSAWLVVLAVMFGSAVAAVRMFFIATPGPGGAESETAATNVHATAETSGARTGAQMAVSAPSGCTAACPSVDTSAGGVSTGSAPSAGATATTAGGPLAASVTAGPKVAPIATEDPYVDAATPPGSARPSAAPAASSAPGATGAAHVVTGMPSVAPGKAPPIKTSRPFAPITPEKD
jgi:hypothetical protein